MSRWVAVACAFSLLTACATPRFLPAYQASHPQWTPADFPSEESDLAEALAALEQPGVGNTVRSLGAIHLWRHSEGSWVEHPLDAAAMTADALLASTVTCHYSVSFIQRETTRRVWYLFRADRLVAFDHYTCRDDPFERTTAQFARLPAVDAKLEADVGTLLGGSVDRLGVWGDECPALELYQRGLAYARAERTTEALEMRDAGDSATGRMEYEEACRSAADRERGALSASLSGGATSFVAPPDADR